MATKISLTYKGKPLEPNNMEILWVRIKGFLDKAPVGLIYDSQELAEKLNSDSRSITGASSTAPGLLGYSTKIHTPRKLLWGNTKTVAYFNSQREANA